MINNTVCSYPVIRQIRLKNDQLISYMQGFDYGYLVVLLFY